VGAGRSPVRGQVATLARADPRDAAAVARCLAGQREAFTELVERYQHTVYGVCLRWCGGRAADASDLAQECFLRAWTALGRFDPRRPLRPWLLRIAVNLCRDWARRRAAHPEAGADDADEVPDPTEGPEEAAERAETRRRLRQAVRALPEPLRLLVVLAYDHDLPLAEVAAATGLPLTVVKNRLFRARRAIARRLASEAEGDRALVGGKRQFGGWACGAGLRPGAPRPARVRAR
jgi:RNA polymerase sigma factor (sigma-70 family)